MGRKGLSVGTQEEEIATLRCKSLPAVETATVFQKLIQTFITIAQKKWHNWWLEAKWLAFLNAYCTVPPSFPSSLLAPHPNFHATFRSTMCAQYWMPWENMIQQSVNCVEYGASKNISRYSITCDKCHSSCIIRERKDRKLETHSVLAYSSQTRWAIMSLKSLKFNSSCKSPLTSYPRSPAQTIYTCSVSCCFCKRNPCIPHS